MLWLVETDLAVHRTNKKHTGPRKLFRKVRVESRVLLLEKVDN